MKFTPTHVHSHYSLLDGLSKIDQITKRCKELGYTSCALTDHGSISGTVEFYKECKKAKIKPILGCEMYISRLSATIKDQINAQDNMDHLVVLAKNKIGWNNLIKAVSRSNDEDVYYYKPRLSLDILSDYSDGLICFSGHPGSELATCLFKDKQPSSYNEGLKFLKSDYFDVAIETINKYKEIFGNNFFVEIQLVDNYNMSSKNLVAEILRKAAKQTNTKCIATGDSHYIKQEDNFDQMVLLCSSLNMTLPKINNLIRNNQKVPLAGFFKSNEYHIPEPNYILAKHKGYEEEIVNTEYIESLVEEYDILSKPQLPSFNCPDNKNESQYLRELCENGFSKFDKPINRELYNNRLNKELKVFNDSGLAGYFLIVQDYVNWAKQQGYLIGPGRGCFLPDTLIKLPNNEYKKISDIKNNDSVIDANNNIEKVYNTFTYDIDEEIVELEFVDGRIIKCTKDHLFLTKNRGWVEAQYLTEEDDVVEV